MISLGNLKQKNKRYAQKKYHHPISIEVNNNYIYGHEHDNEGILLAGIQHKSFSGKIYFSNKTIENTRKKLKIANISFKNSYLNSNSGGIKFTNTYVFNNVSRRLFTFKIISTNPIPKFTFKNINFGTFHLDKSRKYSTKPRQNVTYTPNKYLKKHYFNY